MSQSNHRLRMSGSRRRSRPLPEAIAVGLGINTQVTDLFRGSLEVVRGSCRRFAGYQPPPTIPTIPARFLANSSMVAAALRRIIGWPRVPRLPIKAVSVTITSSV